MPRVGEIAIKKIDKRVNEIYEKQVNDSVRLIRQERKWKKHETLYMLSELIRSKQITPEFATEILGERLGLPSLSPLRSHLSIGYIDPVCFTLIKFLSKNWIEKYSFFPIKKVDDETLQIIIACPDCLPEFKKHGKRVKLELESDRNSLKSILYSILRMDPRTTGIKWLSPAVTPAATICFCIEYFFPRPS